MQRGADMDTSTGSSTPRFVLVVGLEEGPEAERVLNAACSFARSIAGAELHLVHAVDPDSTAALAGAEVQDVALVRDRALSSGRAYLDEKAKSAQRKGGVTVIGHLRTADAARAIVQTAASTDADLVVVGTHDRKGVSRWVLGSVAERVMRDAACPVLVVRPKHHAVARAPEIEAPCVDCLRVQRVTSGKQIWCARHSAHHPTPHLHYEVPQGFGEGSSLIRP
jgi:nucleotide-binding universal stress UspA family protein